MCVCHTHDGCHIAFEIAQCVTGGYREKELAFTSGVCLVLRIMREVIIPIDRVTMAAPSLMNIEGKKHTICTIFVHAIDANSLQCKIPVLLLLVTAPVLLIQLSRNMLTLVLSNE